MGDTKEIANVQKLSFWQIIEKKFLISRITDSRYISAPVFLQTDPDVVKALLTKNINYFDDIKDEYKVLAIKDNLEFFEKLNEFQKDKIILLDNSFVSKLSENDIYELVLRKKKIDLYKYIPKDIQIKLITEKFSYVAHDTEGHELTFDSNPEMYFNYLDRFNPDYVESAIYQMYEELKSYNVEAKKKINNFRILSKIDIARLPVDTQMRLGLIDSNLLARMSHQAALKFIGDNPFLIEKLDYEIQKEFVKDHPDAIRKVALTNQIELIKEDRSLINHVSDRDLLYILNRLQNRFDLSLSDIKRALIQTNKTSLEEFSYITKYITNKDELSVLAGMQPNILSTWNLTDYESIKKIDRIFRIYMNILPDEEIHEAFNEMKVKLYTKDAFFRNNYLAYLAKVVLNKNAVVYTSIDDMVSYIKNPCIEKLINIIIGAYGESRKVFFEDEPLISIDNILNLDLFDDKIINKFGVDRIKKLITYRNSGAMVLSILAQDDEAFARYEKFEKITEGYFSDTEVGFENKLLIFNHFENMFENLDIDKVTDKQKEEFLIIINEKLMNLDHDEELKHIKSFDELSDYISYRNDLYQEACNKLNDGNELKNILSRRFFGILYESREELYRASNLSVKSVLNYYRIIKNDEELKSKFTEDELDCIQLLYIINNISNAKILKEMFNMFADGTRRINPISLESFKYKIPEQYSIKLIESLLDFDKTKEKAKAGVPGVDYRRENDVDIIRLSGLEFKILVRSTGIHNGVKNIPEGLKDNDLLKTVRGDNIFLRGSVIDSNNLKYVNNAFGANLGYNKIPEEYFLSIDEFRYVFGRIDELKDYRSIKHKYLNSEERRSGDDTQDESLVSKYIDIDKRILPDYIVVYGNASAVQKMISKEYARKR